MSSETTTLPTHPAPTAMPPAGASAGFLEPDALILASGERRFVPPAWPVLLIAFALILGSSSLDSGGNAQWGQVVVFAGLTVLWVGHGILRRSVGRSIAAEVAAVTTLEELIQLRRWPEAADLAQKVLSRPMYLRERRMAALVSLATLLTRYHRFSDARIVHEYLLAGGDGALMPDASTSHSLRVARAMGMLREDHLVDADKAMSDLRREVNRARDEVRRERGAEAALEVQSAGLVLLELYRDVKTRHYEEACENFDRSLAMLRQQLGLRVADAWVLVAAARDGLGQTEAARLAYENATTLAPALELQRRYPETQALADRYVAATWPAKAGQA
jgi:tetratricopeptide (TPR) repeat protein